MNYNEAVSWINQFHRFGMKLGVDRINEVLQRLDNPHKDLQCIHVAGTNGKGSVCRFIGNILAAEGYRVGLYLSPHLIDFRERFLLNNEFISKNRLVEIVQKIRPIIEEYTREKNQLTYFEICTIIAFVFFEKSRVDYAVIEVGLGGRCDATNVITPLVSVITNVSLDHQAHLGDEVRDIAREKAGIIKKKIPVVTSAIEPALSVIKATCSKLDSSLQIITHNDYQIKQSTSSFQIIQYHGIFDDYTLSTHQIGTYQAINVSVSIAVIELLQQQGLFITKQSIIKGIREMNHSGRMQIIGDNPLVVVDGAHNPDSMKIAVDSISKLFSFDRLIVLFGVMNDKSIQNILKELIEITDIFVITRPDLDRAANTQIIIESIKKLDPSKQIIETKTIQEAHEKAIHIANDHDIIFATGSLFTVGEILKMYKINQ